jgi:phosphate transport system permease protein
MATPLPPLRHGRPSGEPLVWLCATGLALGLAMVAWLMLSIIANGVEVFWPRHIAALTLADGSSVLVQRVREQVRSDTGAAEVQVYVGQPDLGGIPFRFLAESEITAETLPDDAMLIERLDNGNLLAFPVELLPADGPAVAASDPAFADRLAAMIATAAGQRERLRHLQRVVIGANSTAIANEELAIRGAERTNDAAAAARARSRITALRAEYETLATESRRLQAEQRRSRLAVRLADGRRVEIGGDDLFDAHFPNQLSVIGRLGRATHNLWAFLSENPRKVNTEGGIFPAIFGTFVMTLLMSVAVTPFGVLAAIYLREYASQGAFVRAVRIAINNLAGVPSIVFGVFGLGFFVYLVGGTVDGMLFPDRLPTPTYGTGGIIWAALTLALMTVPVVIVATEEAIAAVPRGAREGSLAMGASKWQTVQRIILPAAVPGILTGLILAMARGAGEVAPLMLVGVVKSANALPIDGMWNDTDLIPFIHLDQKFMHLGFHIYDLGFQSPDSDAAKPMVFATTFVLILLVLVLNLSAILLRDRLRRRFATAAF